MGGVDLMDLMDDDAMDAMEVDGGAQGDFGFE